MDLNLLGITGMPAILLTFFVVGFVEMIKALYDRDWRNALIIFVSAICGAAASPLLGISLITGICGGFAASGVVTMATHFGKN